VALNKGSEQAEKTSVAMENYPLGLFYNEFQGYAAVQ
jgi:hypothetical protein